MLGFFIAIGLLIVILNVVDSRSESKRSRDAADTSEGIEVNPYTGLPMAAGGVLDVGGNFLAGKPILDPHVSSITDAAGHDDHVGPLVL